MTKHARAAMPIVIAGLMWWVSASLAASPWIANMHGQGGAIPAAGTSARSVWDKVYSDAQAQRGHAAYLRECAPCHGDDLRGSGPAPALGPDDFLFLWENRTVGDLFERIRTRMPPDRPDSLPPEAYRDVVAFLLSANMFPAGDKDLDVDAAALRQIHIVAKPPSGR